MPENEASSDAACARTEVELASAPPTKHLVTWNVETTNSKTGEESGNLRDLEGREELDR